MDLVFIKIGDDILATGTDESLKSFETNFGQHFDLGLVTYGPGWLRLYGINIIQYEDF